MSVYFVDKTAAEYRKMAADCNRASAESFERCDTDGFLSQWASDTTARLYRVLAEVAENGGKTESRALFFEDGTLASYDIRQGEWGPYFLLNDEAAARYGKRFVSLSKAAKPATRAKNYAKKGFTVGTVKGDAIVLGGGNMTSVHYYPVIANGAEVEIVSTSNDTEDYSN